LKGFTLACAFVALFATAASAANQVNGWGPRVGASVTPDQLVFGAQLHLGEVAPNLTLDPNIEIGIGDDQTVVQPNFDLQYHLDVQNSVWKPYVGGGLGIAFVSWDTPGPGLDDSDTTVGANAFVGVEAPTKAGNRFFLEARFGLGDLPSAKFMAGWNFKM
jgi:opacity protein-like surface antigen